MQVLNLPKNTELEKNILGSVLLDKRVLPMVMGYLKEDVFYDYKHQIVFRTIKNMYDKNINVDLSTVFQKICDDKQQDNVSAYDLSKLTDNVASTHHINTHVDIVIELYKRRKLVELGQRIKTEATDGLDSEDLFALYSKELINLQEYGNIYEKTIDDIIMTLNYTRDKAQQGQLLGFNTGFDELNSTIAGWCKPDLIVLAARPGMGKTAMMLSSIHRLALIDGIATAVFSLEMSSEQLVERLESIDSEIALKRLRMNILNDQERKVLLRTDDKILQAPLYIDDSGGLSITQLRSKATVMKQKYGIKAIFIDYLQLMSNATKNSQNREQEVSAISRGLKSLAKELEVPIIALSQLSRRVEDRADKMPQLSDLRESGAIEQDSDIVIMLMRPAYYEMKESIEIGGSEYSPNDLVICKVEKNRQGVTKNIPLRFIGETMTFTNYTH